MSSRRRRMRRCGGACGRRASPRMIRVRSRVGSAGWASWRWCEHQFALRVRNQHPVFGSMISIEWHLPRRCSPFWWHSEELPPGRSFQTGRRSCIPSCRTGASMRRRVSSVWAPRPHRRCAGKGFGVCASSIRVVPRCRAWEGGCGHCGRNPSPAQAALGSCARQMIMQPRRSGAKWMQEPP